MFDRNLMKIRGMGAVMGALVVLSLLQAAFIGGQAYTLSTAISALWAGDALESQTPCILAFLACYIGLNLVRFAQDTMLDRFSLEAAKELRRQLVSRVFDVDDPLAGRFGTASVAVSATEGIDLVQTYIRIIPPKIVAMAAVSVPLLVYVYTIDYVSGIILTVLFPVIIFFMVLLGRQARSRSERQYGAYRTLSNRFIDTLRGIDVLETFGAADHEEDEVYAYSEKLRTATIRTLSTATLSSAVLDLCATFGVAAVAIMLAFRLMDASMPLGPALCALMLAPEYFTPIRAFASDFHASLDGKNALGAVLDMIGADKRAPVTDEPPEPSMPDGPIRFDDVSFTYPGATEPALSHVSFSVNEGEHVAIVGASGAGKSTLASLAAGLLIADAPESAPAARPSLASQANSAPFEIGPSMRSSDLRRFVRFVPQHPYIFRATLEDNIRFYAPSASRADVVRACSIVGLDDFVSELPDGLDTQIGEGARGLSGGQAHRVALARILLDESARVLVFDEPTAHLDIETELELKSNMLPVMEGKTVLFATHRMHWLADMDRVITLENGRIVDDDASSAILLPLGWADGQGAGANGNDDASGLAPNGTSNAPSARVARSTKPGWLREYVALYKRHVAVALVLGLVASGFAALLMFASGYLISATATPGMTLFAILLPVAFVQLFGLGKPVARYLERLVSHDWMLKITSDLRRILYRSIRARANDPQGEQSTGEYLSVLDDDISHLQNLYLRVAFPAAIAYLLAIATTILFGAFSPLFAAAMAALLALCTLALPHLALRATKGISQAARAEKSAEYAGITDDIMGATDWILSGRFADVIERHNSADVRYRSSGMRVRTRERGIAFALTLALGCGVCLIVWWSQGAFGAGTSGNPNFIAAFTLGFFPLVEQFATLPTSFADSVPHMDAVARLDGYIGKQAGDCPSCEDNLHTSREDRDDIRAARQRDAHTRAAQPKTKDARSTPTLDRAEGSRETPIPAVSLGAVEYTYPRAYAPALNGLSLDIGAHEKVAVLGKSGSGKTTLAHIVRGRLIPDSGDVALMGNPVKPLVASKARDVGYLSQVPYLFNRTLRENLTLGISDADDAALLDALDRVGLAEKVSSLGKGLDTIVGETGTGFSGGESHRIALARVLVADTPIVLVDEPFAALDPETEEALLDTLISTTADRTLIVITHHLAQIERFDRVVFIEDGVVALDGAPSDLMRANDRFRQLVAFDSARVRSSR